MRIFPLICLISICSFAPTAFGQTTIKARTETGRDVVLSSDGTWKYAAADSGSTPKRENKTLFKTPVGGFGIWYDETKWTRRLKEDDEGRIGFKLKRGDAFAMVITEEMAIPNATLKRIALDNAKEAAPDAQVLSEQTKLINGKEVIVMRIGGTVEGIPFRYYGYYYGGKNGTIQLITFTGDVLFSKYEADFTEFLEGLEIFN